MQNLKFHHLGLATNKPDWTKLFVEKLGYELTCEVIDPLQNVRLTMANAIDKPAIEIIYPYKENGPLEGLLKNQSTSLYHICYTCRSIESTIKDLKQNGFRALQIVAPKPAILFDNKLVGFYQISCFGLIELLEEK